MKELRNFFNLAPGAGYTSSLPLATVSGLNQREKGCLDVLFAHLRVAWHMVLGTWIELGNFAVDLKNGTYYVLYSTNNLAFFQPSRPNSKLLSCAAYAVYYEVAKMSDLT